MLGRFVFKDGDKAGWSICCFKVDIFSCMLQAGYMLYDRVLRPAEVGVTQAEENDATAEKVS